MTSKEEEIKKICYDVVHTYSVSQENSNSYCPFCYNGNEEGKHYEMEDIEHDIDCAYILALKFYKEEKYLNMENYNKGIGHAEHHKILHMLATKLMDEGESPYSTVLEFIEEFDLVEDSEPTGNREYSNDYYAEVEYIFKITEDLGISFWWVECIPHDIDIAENWEFDETLVKLVKPVKVEVIEWQPIIKD